MYETNEDFGYLGGCGPNCNCKSCGVSSPTIGEANGAGAVHLNEGLEDLPDLDLGDIYQNEDEAAASMGARPNGS